MNDTLDTLLTQIRQLEKDLVQEARNKETEFCYRIHNKTVQFTEEARAKHRRFHLASYRYLLRSRFFVLLTAPVIWLCLFPILLVDLVGSFYQAVCFPIYGIPKVKRSDYLAFDRHRLTYLNFVEKINCEYCAYVNGILAYFTEIAGRTEQHWCPIKHAGCVKCAHSRYRKFIDFGDAEKYRLQVEKIRRSYEDIEAGDRVSDKAAGDLKRSA